MYLPNFFFKRKETLSVATFVVSLFCVNVETLFLNSNKNIFNYFVKKCQPRTRTL